MAVYPDISHWIHVKDWSQVKKNCGFIISKATQGTNYIDSTLDSFIKGCEANGIPYWLYTYLNKGNEKAQAEYLVNVCKGKVGRMFIGYVLDIEENNTVTGVRQALRYLKSLGGKCMIYTMYAQYSKYKNVIADRGVNCAWWEARYGQDTGAYNPAYPCHNGVDLHQYTSKGTVAGIGHPVDLNRITGTKSILYFTGEKHPEKKPAKKKALKVGAKIKIKQGAKQYGKSQGFASFVYKTPYKVIQINGGRVVFASLEGVVIGAVSISDCVVI